MQNKKIKELKKRYFKNLDVTDEYMIDFVNHIWHNLLEEDIYLTLPISPLMDYENLIKLFKTRKCGYKVQTKESLQRLNDSEMGLIVNIDWHQTKEVYLPDELTKTTYLDVKPDILGVYLVSANEKEISISYENALILASNLGVPLFNFSKILTPADEYENIVISIISEYLLQKGLLNNLSLRDELIEKYQNDIITAYRLIKKEEVFNANKFIKNAVNYITEHENAKRLKF